MAVAGTLVAWVLYSTIIGTVAGTGGRLLGGAVAAFGSVMASASLCAFELIVSGTGGLTEVLPAMAGVHAMVGLSEALITVAILGAAVAAHFQTRGWSTRGIMLGGLALAAAVAGLIAPLASTAPDGLERVALDLNFANLAAANPWAIAPDYSVGGIGWPALAAALAGVAGVLLVFVSSYLVGRTATVKVRKR